jgi:hypothetical protein
MALRRHVFKEIIYRSSTSSQVGIILNRQVLNLHSSKNFAVDTNTKFYQRPFSVFGFSHLKANIQILRWTVTSR